jgi:hypothetical protein
MCIKNEKFIKLVAHRSCLPFNVRTFNIIFVIKNKKGRKIIIVETLSFSES